MLDWYLLNLTFENVSIEWKRILGPLNIRTASINEWFLHTMNIETFDYNAESWLRETISKGMRRHQNVKCFSCGRIEHLRRYCRQGIPGNNVSTGNGKNKKVSTSWRRCGKGWHMTNKCRSTNNRQGNLISLGNSLGALLQDPKSKVVQSFPITVDYLSPKLKKSRTFFVKTILFWMME